MGGVDVERLELYRNSDLDQLANCEVEPGSLVGVVHCAKWIPSVKQMGKERVALNILEVYLLADPADDGY